MRIGFRLDAPTFFLLAGLLVPPSPTISATITVDEVDCTLVDAITAANTDSGVGGCVAGDTGPDTILLTTDVSLLQSNNNNFGPNGLPVITSEITLEGGGHSVVRDIMVGGPFFRLFTVDEELTLREVTVSGGNSQGDGGGIQVRDGATLILEDSTVTDSSLQDGKTNGGGIWAGTESTLILRNTTVSRNDARGGAFYPSGAGGGIYTRGELLLTDSTVENNSASERDGGGIFAAADATVTIDNSSIEANGVAYGGNGAGIFADSGSTLVIRNSFLTDNATYGTNNDLPGGGGGIFTRGKSLTLTNSTVQGNRAFRGGGGIGIGPKTVATLRNVTVSENETLGGYNGGNGPQLSGGGAGIAVQGGDLTLTDSTISNNTEVLGVGGGGLRISDGGQATLTNSTVSRNVSEQGGSDGLARGAGLLAEGAAEVTLVNTTVSENAADREGGGVYIASSQLSLFQSTLFGNEAPVGGANIYSSGALAPVVVNSILVDGDCVGPIDDGGNNFGDSPGCPGDAIASGVDIEATLADNGGPTETHALLAGSVAIDAAGECPLETDQRGVARSDGACDSGSYEFAAITLTTVGACPGALTVEVTGASPGGTVRLFGSASEGAFVLPKGTCAGAEIGLDDPLVIETSPADDQGELTSIRVVTDNACGLYLRAVDAETCAVSNVVQIP